MKDAELLESLLADVAAAREVLLHDATAHVEHCPKWMVADLVTHHGGVLRWATEIVRRGDAVVEEFPAPTEIAVLADWYMDGATAFIDQASRVDRNRTCWTFGRPPGEAWFWIRRQALEAAIHRWDAELAIGHPTPFNPQLAGVGITEVVDDLFPRQIALGRTRELSAVVRLRATDTGQQWVIGGAETSAEAEATVDAVATALLLLLWRRTDLDDAQIIVSGPRDLAEQLRSTRFTP